MAEPISGIRPLHEAGYLEVDTGGNLLSRRPASRPGDDIVIWSLLISDKTIFRSAEAFWKSMQGLAFHTSEDTGVTIFSAGRIKSGYLVSSTPRLKEKGLRWAPISPTFPTSVGFGKDFLNDSDSGMSLSAHVTADGLVGDWLLWRFDNSRLQRLLNHSSRNLRKIGRQYLRGYRWGVVLRPIQEQGYSEYMGAQWWEDGSRSRQTIVVVCGTNERKGAVTETFISGLSKQDLGSIEWKKNPKATGWEWRGVYSWDNVKPLPEMRKALLFLIT